MKYNKIKGTNDILPEESMIWLSIRREIENILMNYGFEYIITPIMEPYELFTRNIGESSDIVNKEMYVFETKSRKRIALKPEETVVVFRSIIENNFLQDNTMKKLFYFTPLFRHERPQKGRYREFYQFGIEIINSKSYYRDAEVIEVGYKILEFFKIENVHLEINSIGCNTCRPNYRKALIEYLEKNKKHLCEDCNRRMHTNPLRVLDCKNSMCKQTVSNAPKTIDYLCDDCKTHFEGVKKELDNKNIKYTVNPYIVRGLDYYSKTVFEFIEKGGKLGSQSTIIGGGRYDYLGNEFAGKDIPCVGFASGFERLLMSIDNTLKNNYINNNRIVIIYMENALNYAKQVLKELRENNILCEIDYEHNKMNKQMKFADKKKAKYVFICGEDEMEEKKITIKNMINGEQRLIDFDIKTIKEVINE